MQGFKPLADLGVQKLYKLNFLNGDIVMGSFFFFFGESISVWWLIQGSVQWIKGTIASFSGIILKLLNLIGHLNMFHGARFFVYHSF